MVIHIVVSRKPESPVKSVVEHGSGGLNIDASRIDFVTIEGGSLAQNTHLRKTVAGGCGGRIIATEKDRRFYEPPKGRYPANVILFHSRECRLVNDDCPKCGGEGWLWWDELDEYSGPADEIGRDNTKYICDCCDGDSTRTGCVVGCLVQKLDNQSGCPDPAGNLRGLVITGGTGNCWTTKTKFYNPKILGDRGGGASRFFKTLEI